MRKSDPGVTEEVLAYPRRVEILDTTLRDGEQTCGVSFTTQEKLSIIRLLIQELHVDRVEIASARVSEGVRRTVQMAAQWAKENGVLHRLEVLGFVDGDRSLRWIADAGCKVVNLLCKGSLNHCKHQLHKEPQQHWQDISESVRLAKKLGLDVNVYLEDWSNGMRNSPEYVWNMLEALEKLPLQRVMLPDTLGILNPNETYQYCSQIVEKYPKVHFDFHAHNDYDLAVANVYSALQAGVQGVHVTVNGLGERAGNAPLASVLAVIEDQLNLHSQVCLSKSYQISKIIETYSGIRIASNRPITGDFAFTQVAGIHADGDLKHNLYCSELSPERFGRTRAYALGKTSGKSNIIKNLELMGMDWDEKLIQKLTDKVVEMGDKKEPVTQDELPYIVAELLNNGIEDQPVKLLNYSLTAAKGMRPVVTVQMDIEGTVYEENAAGDGQYHAFTLAVDRIFKRLQQPVPDLVDYVVVIPPGGRTDAYVQTIITWKWEGQLFRTRALDVDQTVAAIKATLKMLNRIKTEVK